MQVAPGFRGTARQVNEFATKSPVRVAAAGWIGVVPVFFNVRSWLALPVFTSCAGNTREVGVRVADAGATPLPDRGTVASPWLVLITSDPVRNPVAVGVNVTVNVHPPEETPELLGPVQALV